MRSHPEISISRLAVYLRFLDEYKKERNYKSTLNSEELANFLDINPRQIRKDLSYFGKFGERGLGYRIEDLREKINRILGLDRKWNLCLCGMGNLGSALFAYRGFRELHLNIVAIFDDDTKKIGRKFRGVRVYSPISIVSVVKKLNIDMAIITVPQASAQEVTDKLIKARITAILNFAPTKLNVPDTIKLRNVDLSTELIHLVYFLSSTR